MSTTIISAVSTTTVETLVAQASLVHIAATADSSVFEYYGGNHPSLTANIIFAVVFFIILIIQTFLGLRYRQWWFFGSWFCGIVLEVIGYAGRAFSSKHIDSLTAYAMQMSCLTFAPSFLMAGIYYILAQLVTIYGIQYSKLRPMTYSYLFIVADVCCIFLQAAGGGIASSGNSQLGSHIMLAGLILQVIVMFIFESFWYMFVWKIYKAQKVYGDAGFDPLYRSIRLRGILHWFILAVSVAVVLILTRSIYRVVEFSQGWDSDLANKEIYVLILDALLICLATITLTIFYPGFAYGRDNELKINKGKPQNFEMNSNDQKSEDADNVISENPFVEVINDSYTKL